MNWNALLQGPGSTVTWVPSVALAPRAQAGSPKCWQLRGGHATGPGEQCKLPKWGPQPPRVLTLSVLILKWPLLLLKTLRVLCKCHFTHFCKIFLAPFGAPSSLGTPVHWTARTPGFYATGSMPNPSSQSRRPTQPIWHRQRPRNVGNNRTHLILRMKMQTDNNSLLGLVLSKNFLIN